MSFFGRYAHVFWIPLFPIGKKSVCECTHCKRTYDSSDYSEKLHAINSELRGRVKSPTWNWAGLMIVGAIFLSTTLFETFRYHDPRDELLEADISRMMYQPEESKDSTSYVISAFLNDFVNEELEPQQFKYLTKVVDDKLLVLLEIPKFSSLEREERPEALRM
ncbi:MAG: hypothetical protein AAGA31_13365, partial [Bacteroidota bacterium]